MSTNALNVPILTVDTYTVNTVNRASHLARSKRAARRRRAASGRRAARRRRAASRGRTTSGAIFEGTKTNTSDKFSTTYGFS